MIKISLKKDIIDSHQKIIVAYSAMGRPITIPSISFTIAISIGQVENILHNYDPLVF